MVNPRLRRREEFVKEQKRKIVCCIVTEGERTEPEYFNWFLGKYFRDGRKVVLVQAGDKKTSPKQVLKRAEQQQKEYPAATVFMVIDDDERPKDEIDYVLNKCNKFGVIDTEKINCVFSNRAFEFWGVLHFKNISRAMGKQDLETETKKYFKDFNPKDKILNPKWLSDDSLDKAIKYAAAARKQNGYTGCSTTNVDELIQFLRENLRALPK